MYTITKCHHKTHIAFAQTLRQGADVTAGAAGGWRAGWRGVACGRSLHQAPSAGSACSAGASCCWSSYARRRRQRRDQAAPRLTSAQRNSALWIHWRHSTRKSRPVTVQYTNDGNVMKCCLFNDPFDNYGHTGSGHGSGELRSGVGWEWNDERWHIPKINPQSINCHWQDSNHESSDL